MISNKKIDDNHLKDNLVQKDEEIPRNAHSTDTEPEAEIENKNIIQGTNNDSQNENKNDQQRKQRKRIKNGFTKLIEKLPSYKYDIPEKQKKQDRQKLIPFNIRETDNNRFCSFLEAFSYIAEHCHKNDLKFSRENCRQYLKECYIIDFAHDEFIPISTHLSQKEFNKNYYLAQRELKYM